MPNRQERALSAAFVSGENLDESMRMLKTTSEDMAMEEEEHKIYENN